MIKNLLYKEVFDNIQSFRFFISLLLCFILIPLGIVINYRNYEKRMDNYREASSLYEQSLTGRNTQDKIIAKGFREPAPLSIFCSGIDQTLPSQFTVDQINGLTLKTDNFIDDHVSSLFGKIDLLFMITYIISLLSIVFTFNSITGEKEEGTLKLILSNSLPRWKLLTAKFMGAFISVSIPLISSILFAVIIILFMNANIILRPENILYLCIIIGVSFLYISVFINVGLLISSLTQKALNSKLLLLFFWVVLVLAVPKISTMVTDIVYPVKPRQIVNLEKRMVKKDIEREKGYRLKEIWNEENYKELRIPIAEEFGEREKRSLANIEQNYRNQKKVQTDIAKYFSRLSPASSYILSVTELAGTGMLELSNFLTQTDQFQSVMEDEVYSAGYTDKSELGYKMTFQSIELEGLPRFQQTKKKFGEIFETVWLDIFLLALFNILLFAGTHIAFIRYDVR